MEKPHSPADVRKALRGQDYLADRGPATAVFLAMSLGRPLLLEGEAGVGKTEVAKALAAMLGVELIRLQCYEGIDASQALYEWDYARQLLAIRAGPGDKPLGDLFGPTVKSCTMFAVQVDGREVLTVEGRKQNGVQVHRVQVPFKEEHVLQCGFCTPGMMLVIKALLDENPDPSEEIRWALSGQPLPLYRLPEQGEGGPARTDAMNPEPPVLSWKK